MRLDLLRETEKVCTNEDFITTLAGKINRRELKETTKINEMDVTEKKILLHVKNILDNMAKMGLSKNGIFEK